MRTTTEMEALCLKYGLDESIDSAKCVMGRALEHAFYERKICAWDEVREAISDVTCYDTEAIDLNMHEKVSLIGLCGDDYGFAMSIKECSDIETEIYYTANDIVFQLGIEMAIAAIDQLEDFTQEQGLEFAEIRWNTCGLESLCHWSEEETADNITCYRYRNVDCSYNCDAYKCYIDGENCVLWLIHELDAETLTTEERTFNAQ